MAAVPLLPILLLGGAALAIAATAKAKTKSSGKNSYTLDLDLPPPLRDQVLSALATEQDPARLEQFAAAIQAQYPLAAASLRLKASLFRGYVPGLFGQVSMPGQSVMVPAPPPPPVPPIATHPIMAPAAAPERPPASPIVSPPTQTPASTSGPAAAASVPIMASPPPLIPPASVQIPSMPSVSIQTLTISIQTPATPSVSIPTSVPSVLGGLDPGMPLEMQRAVAGALTTESDPAKLEGFASAIQSQYPVAAGLLVAKASALRLAQPKSQTPPVATSLPPIVSVPMGGTYRVAEGDYAIKIAKAFTGEENRWKELIKANPQKKKDKNGNFATLYAGEVLKLPDSWPSNPLRKGGI